ALARRLERGKEDRGVLLPVDRVAADADVPPGVVLGVVGERRPGDVGEVILAAPPGRDRARWRAVRRERRDPVRRRAAEDRREGVVGDRADERAVEQAGRSE